MFVCVCVCVCVGVGGGICVCVCVLGWVEEEACVTDYLTGTDQKIPDWLIKVPFLGKVKAAIRSGIKSRLGFMGFSTSDAILGLWFFS